MVKRPTRGAGEKCAYCKRILESVLSHTRVAATRDHTVPRAKGGAVTVWACRQCNNLKKDMLPEDWRDFMECFPQWWKNPEFANFGRSGIKPPPHPTGHRLAIIPYMESMMVMRHGKDFWKAWKSGEVPACTCCRPPPHGAVSYTAEGYPIVPRC